MIPNRKPLDRSEEIGKLGATKQSMTISKWVRGIIPAPAISLNQSAFSPSIPNSKTSTSGGEGVFPATLTQT
jgi:hypothetical protein